MDKETDALLKIARERENKKDLLAYQKLKEISTGRKEHLQRRLLFLEAFASIQKTTSARSRQRCTTYRERRPTKEP